MGQSHEQWFEQAEYDLGTARVLCDAGRHFYAVFMCHLCLEKAAKGVYVVKTGRTPPRTHSIPYLIEQTGLELSEQHAEFVLTLNRASVATRYPEDLAKLQDEFPLSKTQAVLRRTEEVLGWLKEQLNRR